MPAYDDSVHRITCIVVVGATFRHAGQSSFRFIRDHCRTGDSSSPRRSVANSRRRPTICIKTRKDYDNNGGGVCRGNLSSTRCGDTRQWIGRAELHSQVGHRYLDWFARGHHDNDRCIRNRTDGELNWKLSYLMRPFVLFLFHFALLSYECRFIHIYVQ